MGQRSPFFVRETRLQSRRFSVNSGNKMEKKSKSSSVREFIREKVPDWDDEVVAKAQFKAFSGQKSDCRHRHLNSPSSFYSWLAQAATLRAVPLSVSHLLCIAMFRFKASGLCLLQPMFVYESPTVVLTPPRTQPMSSRSPIRMELIAPSILLRSTLPHQGVLSSPLKKPPSSSSHVPSVDA
ncbi:charged multivesicular body protein 7 isoform X1 [Cucumis melo var. makuwa]|uniref:Charged multivesicular body protein 7 isoform X1 n=1 Tax=Cucumis melo var. makuwa TaxID=1194695 RepID=A0A5A7U8W2_CUCMM|nr:charged multivesicular body protein 7 isoform X1 [Cucumis melo var. makuwa]